jgi:branched-chain amino acid transport system ATP-binding protein
MSAPILELRQLTSGYGKIAALKGVSLHVDEGEIVTIIGANGAGKSTTLMSISGVLPPWSGDILYQGASIAGAAPDTLPARGLCQCPEGRRIFPRLTVEENLNMGAFFRKDPAQVERDKDYAFDLFPVLKERRRQKGGTLSGGEQQMLAIARALMGKPRMLLLDEPSLGLAPLIVKRIFEIIRMINEKDGVTILLVEQNANLALQLATRGYVMETGSIILEDQADSLLRSPETRKAYLGD